MSRRPVLWDWAVAAYGRPGVEPLLLDLQDRGGQCVPYLLWAAWMARSGGGATAAILDEGAKIARDWEVGVVGPLRQVRRRLGGGPHHALRDGVKAAELDAERSLLLMLEALAGPAETPTDLFQALRAGARVWDPGAPAGAMDTLARLLS